VVPRSGTTRPSGPCAGADWLPTALVGGAHHLFSSHCRPRFSGLIAGSARFYATQLPREYTRRGRAALDGTECASGRLPHSDSPFRPRRQINVVALRAGNWDRPGLDVFPGDGGELKGGRSLAHLPGEPTMMIGAGLIAGANGRCSTVS